MKEELKLGTKIRILPDGEHEPYMREGDIATICKPFIFRVSGGSCLEDQNGHYWADFNNCGNYSVNDAGIWCVGTPGLHFEILEENQ